jgi:superfamily II DNA or RNA helicase
MHASLVPQRMLHETAVFRPESSFSMSNPDPIYLYQKVGNYVILPLYLGLQIANKIGLTIVNKFPEPEKIDVKSIIVLKEQQVEPFERVKELLKEPYAGGILNLTTGFGKTVLALKIASEFRLKTIIIVNKIELLDQWRKAINTFLINCKVGLIQGKVFDIGDKDIVLAMLQSVSIKDTLTSNDFSTFGLCFIDEVHNVPSNVFSKVAFKVRPRYTIGLSATYERKDKMHVVLDYYCGKVLYSDVNTASKQYTRIKQVKYKGSSSIEKYLFDGSPAVSTMITNICQDKERTHLVVTEIQELLKNPERQILVISDRVQQLQDLHALLGEDISGLFTGKTKDKEASKQKRVLLGTYGLTNEGFNLPKLNTLVFASPRSSITQAIGRIFRKEHLVDPCIVDIIDNFSIFRHQAKKRRKIYEENIKNCLFENETPRKLPELETITFLE